MSADTLPYTVLILLVELAVGSLVFVTWFERRGQITHGYVQMGGVVVVPTLLLAIVIAFAISPVDVIDGFTLRSGAVGALRVALLVFMAIALVNLVAAFAERMPVARWSGVLGGAWGVVTLAILAVLVAGPAWSYVGVLGSMLAASVALGGSMMAMSWGHWYLTNSGLPKEPLEEMSLVVLGALVAQAAFAVVAAAAPVREVPLTQTAFGVALGENPAFWFRVGVGLIFPAVLAWLAWRAAAIRGMMAATGLLYIAVGAVLTGEVLARGLLFATGAAV
ncbi:MAG: hypothetical protein F4X26_03955 [Chloroflexi bacterium]|nr:hypothetical protein [Chloroflexota bacterium]MYD65128.1 hypothetical protein [Chloroflexota bacterium]